MKRVLLSAIILVSIQAKAQNVGINSTGAAAVTSAALDVDMANKGILIPRVALTTTTAFAPVTGTATASLLVYNTATAGTFPTNVTPGFYYWTGSAWVRLMNSGNSWELLGNAGTTMGTNFVGTTDNVGFDVRTNNTLRQRTFNTGESVFNNTTAFSGDVLSSYAAGSAYAINGYSTGSGVAGYFQTTGTSDAVDVLSSSATAGSVALYASSSGASTVRGLEVDMTSTTNTGIGIGSFHSGNGRAANFQNTLASNTAVTLFASQSGLGRVINAQNSLTTSTDLVGFFSQASTGTGVATYGNTAAIWGQTSGIRGGVFLANANSANTVALQGANSGTGAFNGIGVYGQYTPTGTNGYGVWGQGNLYGVYSNGNFGATGTKAFHIDHPLDPENKYLNHYSMESPEVLNVYRGNVIADNSGNATIVLPDYFHAINTNFSYVLTPIGAPASLYVATEVNAQGQFSISGAAPGQKVSWYVYAERNDPYVQTHPQSKAVVIEKDEFDKGTYLSPESYNQPASKGLVERYKVNPSAVGNEQNATQSESRQNHKTVIGE